MFKTFMNIFRVPELRNKVLFTLMMLAIYRIGYHVPIPGVNQQAFEDLMKKQRAAGQSGEQTTAAQLAAYVSLFSGGNLSQSTIFGLGVMPYISSSIIFQLLATVVPSLEKLKKEGETGRKKIQEWTRYTTVPLCVVQAIFWMTYMQSQGLVYTSTDASGISHIPYWFWFTGIVSLTSGSIFLMWLGEQIDEYGLGNGVSLIILAGIVARMPGAVVLMGQLSSFSATPDDAHPIGPGKIIFMIAAFIFVIAGSILITQAQRRIPVQQAKHTRGRRVYGGGKQYLPLRVNHGGVMPIIFAQSLMLFPGVIFDKLNTWINANGAGQNFFGKLIQFFHEQFGRGHYFYIIAEIAMIYFFSYFWTTVQFQPKEMANQLRDYGSFIPGLRPGKRTADYLEKVMMRMTYVGGAFLCIIAVIPATLTAWLDIPPAIAAFLGGTGLLIVVSVALDMVQRIESNLVMRNYGTFLGGPGQKGKRIKGRQY